MSEFSILGFIAHLAEMTIAVETEKREALEHAAKIVAAEAKRRIGHDENPAAGPFMAWEPLADVTKEDKARLGYTGNVSAYDSELRTGEMRDSIEHTVSQDLAVVGSNAPEAVAQELGEVSRNLPPRSFLGAALASKGEEVAEIIGLGVVKALTGGQVPGGSLAIP
jgi:phage gpG-like protein